MFFGQGGELLMGEDSSAEERIKALLGDSVAGLARRRILRRPLSGSSGYQSQASMVFSERERDISSPSLVDPLSEMLMQLAATRKGHDSSARADTSVLSSLAQLAAEETSARRPDSVALPEGAAAIPAQMCSHFVQELMLAALVDGAATADLPPLDAPATAAAGSTQ